MKQKDCSQIQIKFFDYLIQDLDPASSRILSDHLENCESCKLELEQLTSMWTKLKVLPEAQPSPHLRQNFYSMLEKEMEKKQKEPPIKKILNFLSSRFNSAPKLAYSILTILILVAFGFMTGFYTFSGQKNQYLERISELMEIKEKNQHKLVLAYLDQQSPFQRLKGISESTNIKNPDNKLLSTLLDTLNNDHNINVRLSAVDALYLYTNNPLVKKGLIESLPTQKSPLVQIALIDLLTEIREIKAIQALKKLLQRDKLNPDVKKRVNSIIKQII